MRELKQYERASLDARLADDYLEARGIAVTKLDGIRVGGETIAAQFDFDAKRGVVLAPKKGRVSGEDLVLLASEGVFFVVEDGARALFFYQRVGEGNAFVLQRALEATASKPFLTEAAFEFLFLLLRQSVATYKLAAKLLSNVWIARLEDEEAGDEDAWDCTLAGSIDDCQTVLKRVIGALDSTKLDMEVVLKLCALLSGFRLSAHTRDGSTFLMNCFVRVQVYAQKDSVYSLPEDFEAVFRVISGKSDSILVASATLGSQFSALTGNGGAILVLNKNSESFVPIYQKLLPKAHVTADDYLECVIEQPRDTILLIPNVSKSMRLKTEMPYARSFLDIEGTSRRYLAAYLYVFKAIEEVRVNGLIVSIMPLDILSGGNHVAFRTYLDKRVQILGAINLPSGYGYPDPMAYSLMVFMRKVDSVPSNQSFKEISFGTENAKGKSMTEVVAFVEDLLQIKDQS